MKANMDGAGPARAAFLTDRYELSMLVGYVRSGLHARRAVCEAFVRRLPPARAFVLVAGIERIARYLADLRFTDEEIARLAADPVLGPAITPGVRAYLSDFRFRGDLHAMPEGTVAFPGEPLLRVEASLPEAQLVETLILSVLNHDARVASKAARAVLAAGARPCFEFGSRRTHELAAVDAARAAYLAGFAGTSNEEAGRRYGIPVSGTCAHMWVTSFAEEGEEAAFRAFVDTFPGGATLLVDTFDTLAGIDRAIAVAGPRLSGVRLDSGDLAALSRAARSKLDGAGLERARVVASGDLNEYRIRALDGEGARIDAFGIGTDIVCTPDAPALGAVYKLVAVEGARGELRPVAKRSEGKTNAPGAKQVHRMRRDGRLVRDEVALASEPAPAGAEPLLVPVIRGGKLVFDLPGLEAARARARAELASLPEPLRRIPAREGEPGPESASLSGLVTRSAALDALCAEAIAAGARSPAPLAVCGT